MKLSVREMQLSDIANIVDYFLLADDKFLRGMGADKDKFPRREAWICKLKTELKKQFQKKEFYYVIWQLDGESVGHSNINNIEFGKNATMHLHLWNNSKRKRGMGVEFMKLTYPYYFKNFELKTLICEPFSENVAPNKLLKKIGFRLIKTYETIPGWINYKQIVNRYELARNEA